MFALDHFLSIFKSILFCYIYLEIYTDMPSGDINGTTILQDILTVAGEGSTPDLVYNQQNRQNNHGAYITHITPGDQYCHGIQ